MSTLSSFLFARPSFAEGFGRAFDFGNTLQEYNQSPTPREADFCAFASDWQAVGVDIQAALETALQEQGSSGVKKLGKTKETTTG